MQDMPILMRGERMLYFGARDGFEINDSSSEAYVCQITEKRN